MAGILRHGYIITQTAMNHTSFLLYLLFLNTNTMPPTESSSLLPGQANRSGSKKFAPLQSTRHLLLGSYINVLLVAVPLSFIGMSRITRLFTDIQPRLFIGVPSLDSASRSSLLYPLQRYEIRVDQP